jgi:hypothetical protein
MGICLRLGLNILHSLAESAKLTLKFHETLRHTFSIKQCGLVFCLKFSFKFTASGLRHVASAAPPITFFTLRIQFMLKLLVASLRCAYDLLVIGPRLRVLALCIGYGFLQYLKR